MRRPAPTAVLFLTLACAAGGGGRALGSDGGRVLGPATWQDASDLLPPEILRHYRRGEYRNPIVAYPQGSYRWPPDFLKATEANRGRFALGPRGEIIEKSTGRQPPYIFGLPFPDIDPDDPAAGAKIVWNYFYRVWYFGNIRAQTQLNWVKPDGLERRTDSDVRLFYYDGVRDDERPPNPQNLLLQQFVVMTFPADVHGTANLTWRFRDPDKRDSTWAYVPALRRVRAISPANRSDGFLGSDLSQDDGRFFNGKVEDFTWKLIGEKEQLRLVDPDNLAGRSRMVWRSDGGWRANWDDVRVVGYMDPEWKGIAWAPISAALARRRFWIVEGTPRDRYYLYGRIQLYVDRDTYQGAWNRKFTWSGELVSTLQAVEWNPIRLQRPDGSEDYVLGSNMAFQCVENLKLGRATVAGIKSRPDSALDTRVPYTPSMFEVSTLTRFGK